MQFSVWTLVFKYKEIDRAIENLNDRDTYLNELNNEIGKPFHHMMALESIFFKTVFSQMRTRAECTKFNPSSRWFEDSGRGDEARKWKTRPNWATTSTPVKGRLLSLQKLWLTALRCWMNLAVDWWSTLYPMEVFEHPW